MKKLLLLLSILHSALCTTQAQQYQMRAAIEKAVFSDKLLTINSFSNSGFDVENGETRRWSVLQYEFSLKKSDAEVMQPIMKAFDKDRADKRTTSFVKSEPTTQMYSFLFSTQHSPVTIGSLGQARALVAIVGDEKPNQNTVIAMECWKNGGEGNGGDVISGKIYIIERDPMFKASPLAASNKPEEPDFMSAGIGMLNEVLNNISENVRRLAFYAQKYEIDCENGTSSTAIVKATVYVVSDIIQKGTNEEKMMALQLIDKMIMATPDPTQTPISNERKAAYKENGKTLLNLLSRLGSKTEYSSMKSSPKTFRINGVIDEELWDIGYYISTSDETMTDPTNNAELVKAEGQTFHYQAELDDIRLGRVRALFKDGTICSAWIEMLFVPGETAELHVHNGHYTLSGTGFYDDWNSARNELLSGTIKSIGSFSEDKVLEKLKKHTDKPAFFVFAFKENLLSSKENRTKAYNLLPDDIKQSPYGVFLRKYL